MYGRNPSGSSRESNEPADVLSGVMDDDHGYVNPAVFAWLGSLWGGPHTVDRFADCDDGQFPCFHSRCWNPGSEAVHTFTTD